jgi:hypothetical protein
LSFNQLLYLIAICEGPVTLPTGDAGRSAEMNQFTAK